MIDLRKKEAAGDKGNPYAKAGVVYTLVYKGSDEDANKLASALKKKPSVKNGNVYYFKYMTDRDAYRAFDNNEIKFKGLDYKQIKNDEWKKIKDSNDLKKESVDMIDLREKKTSKHEEDEIKFVNKGEKFKSEKADDVKIVDIEKKDDKTEVTYKLGDEEKKGDIEDVLKMLNGAEYKKVDDKKDEKKSCESEDDEDGAEDGVDAGEDDGEQTDEKKAKKEADDEDDKDDSEDDEKKDESANDGSVEITITEEFHVPGTDIVFEAGDVIKIIPRKED